LRASRSVTQNDPELSTAETTRTLPSAPITPDSVWPDTIVVETNLANLVGEIRTALGDDPGQPGFIRTVHRFGYAFRRHQTPADR
jgi:DNA-binding response OmpR family regulator